MTLSPDTQPSSQRERNKQDKLRRIKAASLELFISKGYDDTTTREIAVRAGVGLGTVFVYARTKRDLLFLVVNEDLERTVDEARAAISNERSLLANLVDVARRHYAMLARQPDISRLALREMYFYASGTQAERFLRTRERLIQIFVDIVADGLKRGLISSDEDAETIAWVIFALFQIDIRRFLMSDGPSIAAAMKRFAKQLRILMVGLQARPEALTLGRSSGR